MYISLSLSISLSVFSQSISFSLSMYVHVYSYLSHSLIMSSFPFSQISLALSCNESTFYISPHFVHMLQAPLHVTLHCRTTKPDETPPIMPPLNSLNWQCKGVGMCYTVCDGREPRLVSAQMVLPQGVLTKRMHMS